MNVASDFLTQDYLDALNARFETAPRDMAAMEALLLWGLGAAAALFLLFAVMRRSSGAAVSFSLVTLTALVAAMSMGRLEFLPAGTIVMVLSLYACAVLLFLAAAIKTVRDNTLIGALVLIAVLALASLGGASALGVVEGGEALGWSLMGVAAFAVLFTGYDLSRGDKAAMFLAPGVFAAVLSPLAMLFTGPDAAPVFLVTPLFLLAGGTIYAAAAAMVVLSRADLSAPAPARRGSRFAPSYADEGTFFGEIGDLDGTGPEAPPFGDSPLLPEAESGPLGSPPAFAAAAPPAMEEGPRFGQRDPAPNLPRDPSSSYWGRADEMAPPAHTLPDEYIFAPGEAEELRAGEEVLRLFDLRSAEQMPPEELRAALAPESLDVFDDEVVGGADPRPGRFSVELALASGRQVVFEGRRDVDEDGLLCRLEGQFAEAGRSEDRRERAASPPLAAALMSGGPRAAREAAPAPLTATPPLAAPSQPRAEPLAEPVGMPSAGDPSAALDRGEIAVYFQPILRLSDRQTVGFEALARWLTPSGEVLEAGSFVPALVEAGRGLDLMALALEEAARELAAWIEAQPGLGQFVSVNLAATDLPRAGLSDLARAAVSRHGLPEGALVVELGEDRIKTSQNAAMKAAKALRAAGVSLAIDDFGTGHANLARLSRFEFDLLKTDRSLALAAAAGKKGRAAVKGVVEAAHKAGMPVIAEGIEDEETAAIMAELGCDFGQGFLFGHPEPASGSADGHTTAGGRPKAAEAKTSGVAGLR